MITVSNHSTLVTDEQAQLMVRACAFQVRYELAPLYGIVPPPITFFAKDQAAPPGAWVIAILDDPDQANDLGWHTENQGDVIFGRVFAKPVLDNGGDALSKPLSVASVLSHEVLETACLTPNTRVLTEDLRWVSIDSVLVGEALLGFDEYAKGQGARRRWRRSIVEDMRILEKPCYDLVFEDGTSVTCSDDHKWLVNNGGRAHWIEARNLRPLTPAPDARGRVRSEGIIASRVLKPLEVWETEKSYEAGYIAGALDGEGCLSHYTMKGNGKAIKLMFVQRYNAMLELFKMFLKEAGYEFSESHRAAKKENWSDTSAITISKPVDVLHMLGSTRPVRLLEKFNIENIGCMRALRQNAPRLITKNFVGEKQVIALQTSTSTFLAEGLASHNCDNHVNLWADRGDGTLVAYEVADPVENDSYEISLPTPTGTQIVTVSNFVTPHWFDPQAAPAEKFDWLQRLKAPFAMSRGGYVVLDTNGNVTQVFGDEYPEWKKELKKVDTARTARRLKEA